MTKRFVLIDQSIKAPGGHHYEYAQRILDAARRSGYETLLLANREYKGEVDHRVIGAFSRTFWDNYRHYYSSGLRPSKPPALFAALFQQAAIFARKLAGMRHDLKRRFIASSFGLALARARQYSLKDIVLRPHLDVDFSYARSNRFLLLVARILLLAWSRVEKLILLFQRVDPKRLILLTLFVGASPILFTVWLIRLAGRRDPAALFAKELGNAFEVADLTETIVFVPNATPAETEGLITLCQARHRIANAHWAFLYRRPIFSGYPGRYKVQMEAVRHHRVELARIKVNAPKAKVSFYTDTEELSEQYNMLGIFPFATLPVPVDPQPSSPTRREGPITIGYLGDARDEKGFQYLPKAVETFLPRNSKKISARFSLQANFNVPGGEPGSRYARSLLEQYETDFVKLLDGPFDSKEYDRLLKAMDVVLIPYSAENYSARSSGVLMEAISLGLPVLVPACSWMAGLLEPSRRQHFLSIVEKKQPLASIAISFEDVADKTILIDERADHVLFRLRFDAPYNGYVRICITSINEFDIALESLRMGFKTIDGEVIALFRKPQSPKLWWKAETIEPDASVKLAEAEVSIYQLEAALPLGAGAEFFDSAEDIPRAMKNLVDFYLHHKTAAESLRDALRPDYEPAVLIERLESSAFSGTKPKQEAFWEVAT